MKFFAAILLGLLLAASASAGTFHCQWLFRDAGSNVIAIKEVLITPIAPYGVDSNNIIITGDRKTYRSDSAGSLIVSNLFNGRSYRVQITGPQIQTTFTNSFDTNVTGLVNGADPQYLTAPIRDGSTTAYSRTQTDALLNAKVTTNDTRVIALPNASVDTATNVPAGGNIGGFSLRLGEDQSLGWVNGAGETNISFRWSDGLGGGIFASHFIGEGSGITNVNADTISATESNRLRSGYIAQLAQPTNNISASNIVSGTVISTNYIGNGSGATNIPAQNIVAQTNFNRSELSGKRALQYTVYTQPWTNDLLTAGVGGDPLAHLMPTPPIIWNSWYAFPGFELLPSHWLITNAIHMILTNGDPCRIIEISDGWTAPYRTNGLMVWNWTNFPNGITQTVNYAHSMGFKIRIYTSYNAPGLTCGNYIGSTPETVESDFQQFADWGFDGVTVDACEGRLEDDWYQIQLNRDCYRALLKAGRPMTIHTANQSGAKDGMAYPESMAMVNMLSGFNTNRGLSYPYPQEFAVMPLSNYWWDAWQWVTGPYYDRFSQMQRPGHYNIHTHFYMAGSADSEAGLKNLYNQLSILGMFSHPMLYGAWTNTLYRAKVFTNSAWLGIHQDSNVRYPTLISSNNYVQIWQKRLTGTNFGKTALMIMNTRLAGDISENVSINFATLGMDTNREIESCSVWRYTNIVTTTATRTFTVQPDDAELWIVGNKYLPPRIVNDEGVLGFQSIAVDGVDSATMTHFGYGPAPWYPYDGVSQTTGNNLLYATWPAPPMAKSAHVRYQITTAATGFAMWTNYLQLHYNSPTERVILAPDTYAGTTNSRAWATNAILSWATNYMTWDPTNTSVVLTLIQTAGTNANARYIMGPLHIRYGY